MLVGYSSSEEEEEEEEEDEGEAASREKTSFSRKCPEEDDGNHGNPARKKHKTEEELPKTRLPLPGFLLDVSSEDRMSQTEDSSLHGGRIRSFKHERGNWATYVYLPYQPEEEFEELLEEVLSVAGSRGAALTRQEEFHLSLSQTVVLRHHWIQPFSRSLRSGLASCRSFSCSAGRLKVYSNAEKTRTFLGVEVSSGHLQLLELVQAVDRTMTEFHLDTFYKDPSFHVSLAWCVGDVTAPLQACLQEMQSLMDDREEGAFLLRLDCVELRCRTGNKTFRFPLEP